MRTIEHIEAQRQVVQAALDAQKSARERNQLGQFATPPPLAQEILSVGLDLIGDEYAIHFLDPAIGTGAFFSALATQIPAGRISRALGFDIDPHYAEPARTLWRETGLELRNEDFTAAPPPLEDSDRANLIIANPPYVRHHHLTPARKQQLIKMVEDRLGIRPSGLSGLYCYFLFLCHEWLRPGGIAGWLIPGEWLDVNYGAAVKEYLLDRVDLLRIHRFAAEDVQFADALVSSTVVWFRKPTGEFGSRDPETDRAPVELSCGGTLSSPARVEKIARTSLRASRKWSRLSASGSPEAARSRAARVGGGVAADSPTLAHLFTIKRGMATGANRFFILTESDILKRGLPRSLFRPILPSPRYLKTNDIRALANGDPDIERPLYVLHTREPEAVIRTRYPALWQYLQEGVKRGICERYLCRQRRPWYAQEQRPPAPILCSYMGRISEPHDRPFRFILNGSQATAANVYLLLYPRADVRARSDYQDLMQSLWRALNELPVDALVSEGRVYGGGLHKLEPRELARVSLSALTVELD